MKKRFFWLPIAIIFSSFVVSSLLYIRIFLSLKALSSQIVTEPFGVLSGENRTALKHSLTIIPYVSLGSYRFPFVYQFYQAGKGVDNTLDSLESLMINARETLEDYSQGNIISTQKLDKLKQNVNITRDNMESLVSVLNSPQIIKVSLLTHQEEKLDELHSKISKVSQLLQSGEEFIPLIPTLIGYDKPQHYYLLLQNNTELRPTGGFLGSFAEITLDKGQVRKFQVQDIYVPDGQITGYVKEPDPVKHYLFKGGTPGWHLRDSNWNPDFPQAFQTISWFFEKGGMDPADGMIAVNLYPLLDLLKMINGLYLNDYSVTVTSDNFYQLAQYNAENKFFPGSTQKKDFLSSVSRAVAQEINSDRNKYIGVLLKILIRNLESKQILITHNDPLIAKYLKNQNWDGGLHEVACPENKPQCFSDYLYLNEANVGINKANCCIIRKADDTISIDKTGIHHNLNITYFNNNLPRANSPYRWGGDYKNYLRVFIPSEANVTSVTINGQEVKAEERFIETLNDKQSVGFLVAVPISQNRLVNLQYLVSPKSKAKPSLYILDWQKQSGIDAIPLTLTTNNSLIPQSMLTPTFPKDGTNTLTTLLDKDTIFTYQVKE